MTDIPKESDFPIRVMVAIEPPSWMKTLVWCERGEGMTTGGWKNVTSEEALMNWSQSAARAWLDEKDLLAARDYWDILRFRDKFYMELGFKDKRLAMLFKLTFGGL